MAINLQKDTRNQIVLDMAAYYSRITDKAIQQDMQAIHNNNTHPMVSSMLNIVEDKELVVLHRYSRRIYDNFNAGGGTATRLLTEMHKLCPKK